MVVRRSANPRTAAQSDTELFARDRALAVQRGIYEWDHLPGLPPFCKGLPDVEKQSRYESDRVMWDLVTSFSQALMARRSFLRKLRKKGNELEAYNHLRPYGRRPACAQTWRTDAEFARQRLNGVNPLQIERLDEYPAHLRVSPADVAPLLPEGTTLDELRDSGRLYVCDWGALTGAPVTLGRFLTAPTALFWVDDAEQLMPLAIQLDRDFTLLPETDTKIEPPVFTPLDDPWVWLTARTHVQSADAAYHESVVHLLRTHLLMETVWVAANRGLAPQHPVHRLLKPHFQGTIAINYKARNELIVTGGPIDKAISVGTAGAYWLISERLKDLTFGDLNPATDMERRGVADSEVLTGYHYRDDALRLWDIIGSYTEELLRSFYPDDESVVLDDELTGWAEELADQDAGAMRGLPLVDGAFRTFADLHHVVRQVVFTVAVEHSAVNNGQYDIFGHIPNSPGAIFLPHPTSHDASSEGEFTYGLPPFKVAEIQIALVHLLSQPTLTNLGDYPADFFYDHKPVRLAIDRFRSQLDKLTIDITRRNQALPMPYTYLDPAMVATSISV
nr:polyunsaturated fatty acid lipoxygenase ALOX15B-like [Nerophis lumbriciformis]